MSTDTVTLSTAEIENICGISMRMGAFLFHCLSNDADVKSELREIGITEENLNRMAFNRPEFILQMCKRIPSEDAGHQRAGNAIGRKMLTSFMNTSAAPNHHFLVQKLMKEELCWDSVHFYDKIQSALIDGIMDEEGMKDVMEGAEALQEKIKDSDEPIAKKILAVQNHLREKIGDRELSDITPQEFNQIMEEGIELHLKEEDAEDMERMIKMAMMSLDNDDKNTTTN